MIETYEIDICIDCLFVLANGAETDEQRKAAERMAEKWPNVDITLGQSHDDCNHDKTDECAEMCEEPFFSWQTCEGCGSDLGGDRQKATVWDRTDFQGGKLEMDTFDPEKGNFMDWLLND